MHNYTTITMTLYRILSRNESELQCVQLSSYYSGERNQMNQATSYIDASFVYGVDDESMNKLRLHKKGNDAK